MFFKVLAISLLVMWFVGLVIRATFNRWLQKNADAYKAAATRARKEAERRARDARKKEGEVIVEQKSSAKKQVARGVGEYVEYEEVRSEELRVKSDD